MGNHFKDYLNDILVRMAYNNSAIEGNTITLPETITIILEGTLPSGHKSIREFYEIENHKQVFKYMMDMLENNEPLHINTVKEIHSLLTDRLQHDKGQFKTEQNAIVGANFRTASPSETPLLMQQWNDNTSYRLEHANTEEEILKILAESHIEFERIHPFSDGNGRTGRVILMFLSMQYLDVPIVIHKEDRGEYISYLAEQNQEQLAKLLKTSIEFERIRIKEFNLFHDKNNGLEQ